MMPHTMNIKLNDNFYEQLQLQATESPRKRSHYNLHKELDEPVQRLCIALKKGTYVQPHHHPKKNKWELTIVLRGSVNIVIFDREGKILEKLRLNTGENLNGIEIKADTWHTITPHTDEAVILEIKEGPFTPTVPSDFASWAPAEGEADVADFLNWLEDANPGDFYIKK